MPNSLSYWEKESFFNYDIIVVGNGIIGLNTAINLKENHPTLKIAILERGFLPSGASTKNAGFACFGSISELMEQEKTAGTEALYHIINKRWNGLLKLRNRLGDPTIEYTNLGGHEIFREDDLALTNACVDKIEHYNHLISNIVGKDAFYINNTKINSFGFQRLGFMITNRYEAQIDTGKMMFSLIAMAQRNGITILNNCEVLKIDEESNTISLITSQGKFVSKQLAITTNAFIGSLFSNLDISPGRGQILITKPLKNLKLSGTFHYDRGYYYFRNINNRVLLGGGRNIDFEKEETTTFGETPEVQQSLRKLLKEVILPDQEFEIDYSWSGIMAFGKSLQPYIDEVKPNIFCATRCNGMGIAIGTQTAEDLSDMMIKSL